MLEAIIIYYAGVILAWVLGIPSKSRYTAFAALLSWLFVAMWIIGYFSKRNRQKRERFNVYRKMLELAEADLSDCRENEGRLSGFCYLLRLATKDGNASIYAYPELVEHKPKYNKGWSAYWFSTDPYGPDAEKRINILKEILCS